MAGTSVPRIFAFSGDQLAGWVERSDTHHIAREADRMRFMTTATISRASMGFA
jgi:hypothetical protein